MPVPLSTSPSQSRTVGHQLCSCDLVAWGKRESSTGRAKMRMAIIGAYLEIFSPCASHPAKLYMNQMRRKDRNWSVAHCMSRARTVHRVQYPYLVPRRWTGVIPPFFLPFCPPFPTPRFVSLPPNQSMLGKCKANARSCAHLANSRLWACAVFYSNYIEARVSAWP